MRFYCHVITYLNFSPTLILQQEIVHLSICKFVKKNSYNIIYDLIWNCCNKKLESDFRDLLWFPLHHGGMSMYTYIIWNSNKSKNQSPTPLWDFNFTLKISAKCSSLFHFSLLPLFFSPPSSLSVFPSRTMHRNATPSTSSSPLSPFLPSLMWWRSLASHGTWDSPSYLDSDGGIGLNHHCQSCSLS